METPAPDASKRTNSWVSRRSATDAQAGHETVTLLHDLQQQLAEVKPELLRCTTAIHHLELELQEAEHDKADLQTLLAEQRAQLQAYERGVSSTVLMQQLSSMRDMLQKLQETEPEKADLSEFLSELRVQLQAYERGVTNTALMHELSSVRVERDDMLLALKSQQREHARLFDGLDDLEHTKHRLAILEAEQSRLQALLVQTERESLFYQDQLDEAAVRVQILVTDLTSQSMSLKTAEVQLVSTQQSLQTTQDKLANLLQQTAALEDELRVSQARHVAASTAKDEAAQALTEEKNAVDARLSQVIAMLDDKQQALASMSLQLREHVENKRAIEALLETQQVRSMHNAIHSCLVVVSLSREPARVVVHSTRPHRKRNVPHWLLRRPPSQRD
jgi:chromosome segregation ATPase